MTSETDPRAPFMHATTGDYLQLLKDVAHPEGLERQLTYAVECYTRRHEISRDYLSAGGVEGHQARSPKWREADTAVWTSVTMLALLIDSLYPSPTRRPPINEAQELVRHRAGPLCNGWINLRTNTPIHRNDTECPIHSHRESPW